MDNNPDSPDSISSDQLTVDLLTPRSKRRRVLIINDPNEIVNDVERRDEHGTPDINNKNTNNNDVGFVLMDEEQNPENGEEDDEVCIFCISNLII